MSVHCHSFQSWQTMRADVKVATMFVKHNIALAVVDELTPLFRDIFSDSEIAKSFSSRQMKTACIINGEIPDTMHANWAILDCYGWVQ